MGIKNTEFVKHVIPIVGKKVMVHVPNFEKKFNYFLLWYFYFVPNLHNLPLMVLSF